MCDTLRSPELTFQTRLRKPSIHSEAVYKIQPYHMNALRKAGLTPPNFPTMGDLWSKQDERVDIENEPDIRKKENKNVYFCIAYSRYFFTSIHRVVNRLKNPITSPG